MQGTVTLSPLKRVSVVCNFVINAVNNADSCPRFFTGCAPPHSAALSLRSQHVHMHS